MYFSYVTGIQKLLHMHKKIITFLPYLCGAVFKGIKISPDFIRAFGSLMLYFKMHAQLEGSGMVREVQLMELSNRISGSLVLPNKWFCWLIKIQIDKVIPSSET